ncbi:hypothetical protein [Fretibacter rubidus]|uniref:hypothetical protein n=1 Tax=Fretibacter rubidus TaxID=570162 RepID=UPI00352A79B6
MGRVHKLLIRNCIKGVVFGWALLALGLYFNVMGMGDIVFTSNDKILATFLLMVGFAITFGNAAMGHAVMGLARSEAKKEKKAAQNDPSP